MPFMISGSAYLFNKNYALETDVAKLEFENPVHKEIQSYLIKKAQSGEQAKFNELYDVLMEDSKEELSRIAGMETQENKRYEEAVYFNDCLRTIKLRSITWIEKCITNGTPYTSDENVLFEKHT